ncbi:MAG: T9SS type A sorting domain-containing protein, partial [Bacteroidales bacterium]
ASAAYADYIVENTDICTSGTTTFTYYGSFGPDSLSWNFGENAFPSAARTAGPHTVSYSSLGGKTVTLKVYKDGEEYTEVKKDIVNVVSEIEFGAYPEIASVCDGGETYLFASGYHDFVWAPADGLNTTTGNFVIANPDANTTYTVTATSGSCTAEQSVDVLVASNDDICDAYTLVPGPNGYFTNECATAQNNEPVPPEGSDGLLGCGAQDGWCSGETVIHNSVWFKFAAPDYDIVSIETRGFDNQIAVYDAGTCNDLLTGNYELIAANDDFPGRADYSASIQEMTDLVPGNTYWLQVDGSYGGVSGIFSVDINDYRLSSVEEAISESNSPYVNIYPNPNYGIFTVDYLLQELSKVTVRIYNVQGDKVFEKHIRPSRLQSETIIKPDNISKGIYILQFINNNSYFYRKFIVK